MTRAPDAGASAMAALRRQSDTRGIFLPSVLPSWRRGALADHVFSIGPLEEHDVADVEHLLADHGARLFVAIGRELVELTEQRRVLADRVGE